jgi:hypothetical protein
MCATFHIQFVQSATWKLLYTQCRHGKMDRLGVRMLVFLLFIMQSAAHWYRQLQLQGQTYWRQRTANILGSTPYPEATHTLQSLQSHVKFMYAHMPSWQVEEQFHLYLRHSEGRFYIVREYFTAIGRRKLSEFVMRTVTLLTQRQIPELISVMSQRVTATATKGWGYEEVEGESMLKDDCALWHRGYTDCSRPHIPHSLDIPGTLKTKMSHSYNSRVQSDKEVIQHVLMLKCHTAWFTHCPWR